MKKTPWHWFSYLPISKEVKKKFELVEITLLPKNTHIVENCVIVYNTPDEIIKNYVTKNIYCEHKINDIVNVYSNILSNTKKNNVLLIPHWQIEKISLDKFIDYFKLIINNDNINKNNFIYLERDLPDKLFLYLALELSKEYPEWINNYLDVELNAFTFNDKIDSNYQNFLFNNLPNKGNIIDQLKEIYSKSCESDIFRQQIKLNEQEITKLKNEYLCSSEETYLIQEELVKTNNLFRSTFEELDKKDKKIHDLISEQEKFNHANHEKYINTLNKGNLMKKELNNKIDELNEICFEKSKLKEDLNKLNKENESLIKEIENYKKKFNNESNERIFILQELRKTEGDLEYYFKLNHYIMKMVDLHQNELERSISLIEKLFKNKKRNKLLTNQIK